MTDNRKSGIALITGSLGGLLTMAIHPTAAGSLTTERLSHLLVGAGVAHAIAIVSVLALFLGACGLAQGLAAADRMSFAGIVTFGFACVAVFVAATVSGFVIPDIMKCMVQDVPDNAQQWQIVIRGIFQTNQAFGRIYAVAASLAMILWSVSAAKWWSQPRSRPLWLHDSRAHHRWHQYRTLAGRSGSFSWDFSCVLSRRATYRPNKTCSDDPVAAAGSSRFCTE